MAEGALDEAAPVEHLVAKRSRLLGEVSSFIGRELVKDPFDLGTESGDLISREHVIEEYISVGLEALHRCWNGASSESQESRRGPSEHLIDSAANAA